MGSTVRLLKQATSNQDFGRGSRLLVIQRPPPPLRLLPICRIKKKKPDETLAELCDGSVLTFRVVQRSHRASCECTSPRCWTASALDTGSPHLHLWGHDPK